MDDADDNPKPWWQPEEVMLGEGDVPASAIETAFAGREPNARLIKGVTALQHGVATLLAAAGVRRRGHEVRVTCDERTGLLVIEHPAANGTVRGVVVTTESAMQPRHNWPVQVPVDLMSALAPDWVGACSVPEDALLGDLVGREEPAYVIGWLGADEVRALDVVTLVPHIDHSYTADYHQGFNRDMHSFSEYRGVE